MGTKARPGGTRAIPANGGTTARHTGSSRETKMPRPPFRAYASSMCAIACADSSRRPRHARPPRPPAGEQRGDEEAAAAVPGVRLLDVRHRLRRQQPPPETSLEECPTVAAPDAIDQHRRRDVAGPRDGEHTPRIEHAATGEEGAEGHNGVGGDRGEDVFDGGEESDGEVQRSGGERFQPRQQMWHGYPLLDFLAVSASSISTTAITATPSPRPMKPMPSLVFALIEMLE